VSPAGWREQDAQEDCDGARLPCRFLEHRGGTAAIPRSECKAAVWLSRGEALVLVLLASVGLWAAIWGVIALLAAGEGW
jgi:hypothetical protein